MKVTALPVTGNSSKFKVEAKKGEYTIAISYTLRTKIWELADADTELSAATQLAEAIVSRHDPSLPYRPLYIFAEHNSQPSLDLEIKQIRKQGYSG